MENENRIIKMLEYYIDEYYTYNGLPDMFHCKKMTAWWYQRSYQIWAAHEILNMLKSNLKGESIYVTIYDKLIGIRHMFNNFIMKNKPNTQMFVEAYDVATDLLNVVIAAS